MPGVQSVFAVGQIFRQGVFPILVGDGKKFVVDHRDPRTHPGMNVTSNGEILRLIPCFELLAGINVKFGNIFFRISLRHRVDIVKEGVGILDDNVLADLHGYDVWNVLATFLVENGWGFRRLAVVGKRLAFLMETTTFARPPLSPTRTVSY